MTDAISPDPFTLAGTTDIAILATHGFTGTPVTLRHWGEALNAHDWTVRAPLLPGHGTHWEDLRDVKWQDWYETVEEAFLELSETHEKVFLAGISMGSTLSLRLAEKHGEAVAGLMITNPAVLRPDRREIPLLLAADRFRAFDLLGGVLPSVPGLGRDIKHPVTPQQTSYDQLPLNAAVQLVRLTDDVRRKLPDVQQPLLLFSSTEDHVVDPVNSDVVMARVGSLDRTKVDLPDSYHLATLDADAQTIFDRSVAFVERIAEA